jgi:1,4-dihydroxy-2-naphthoate octaprenyltransferase
LRAFSFPLSALPVLVATAAVRPIAQWRWDVLAASVLGAVLLHAAGNLLNDYFDFRSGVDRKTEGDEGRLLIRGEMAPRAVVIEAVVCLVLIAPVAAYLLAKSGPGLLWFAFAAMVGLYAYTGPPFRFKYRAMGEVLIFLAFGPFFVTGVAYVQAGHWDWLALLLSVPVGILTTAVLLGNNIRDLDEDEAAGIETLVHKPGGRAARLVYAGCVLLPPLCVAGLVAAGMVGVAGLLCLLSIVPAYRLVRQVYGSGRIPDIPDMDARTAQCATLFLLTLCLGVTIAWWRRREAPRWREPWFPAGRTRLPFRTQGLRPACGGLRGGRDKSLSRTR